MLRYYQCLPRIPRIQGPREAAWGVGGDHAGARSKRPLLGLAGIRTTPLGGGKDRHQNPWPRCLWRTGNLYELLRQPGGAGWDGGLDWARQDWPGLG